MSFLTESGARHAVESAATYRALESYAGVGPAIADNFDRANGAPGANWTEHSVGSWLIASNKLERQAGGLDEIINNTVLSSDDHYVEADVVGASTEYIVLGARWNGSLTSITSYECFLHPTAGTIRIGKLVANAETILLNQTFAHGNAHKLRFEVQGTALRGYVDGVLVASITDTAITSGKQVGLYASHISINATVDNFAADVFAAVPPTVPGAPTSVSGTPGNGQVSLSWTAPANGGAAITDYTIQYAVSPPGTSWTTFTHSASAATSATVTGLSNGTAYVFQVAAVNSVGTGSYSTASSPVTPSATGTHWSDTTFTNINSGGSYEVFGTFGTSVAGEVYESTGFSPAFARRTDAPTSNDQYVKITVEDLDQGDYLLGVHHPSPPVERMGYWAEYHPATTDNVYFYKNNVFAGNPAISSVSGSGTLELRCVANVCTVYRNGVSIASVDFSSAPITGGYTGFGAANGSATKSITDAEGGDYP